MSLLKLDPNFKPAFDGPALAQGLIDKLNSSLPLHAAYLFGSAAEGKNTINSDLDILLVVPDSIDIKKYYTFVNAPFFSPVAVDWIIQLKTDFEKSLEIGGVSTVATENGIKLKINGSK